MKLHLLNGDAIVQLFQKANLKGDTIVWREILCEGTTATDVAAEHFWSIRQAFLKEYVGTFDQEKYVQLKKAVQDTKLSNYEEIILWFEYDLFCQINLLAALSWLYPKTKHTTTKISLICVGVHPNYAKPVGLGHLHPTEFAALYPDRATLKTSDLIDANHIWAIYCSANHNQLLPAVQQCKTTAFKYLETAIYQHQKRFPSKQNGLTDIELQILQLLLQTPQTKNKLVRTLLENQEVYGFGDLQYFKYLEGLRPLLQEEANIIAVNPLGKKVLANRADFNEIRTHFYNYGGTNLEAFRWDADKEVICSV